MLGCNELHFFHEECLTLWIQSNKDRNRASTCPMCRVAIDESKIETKDYKGIKPKTGGDTKIGALGNQEVELKD